MHIVASVDRKISLVPGSSPKLFSSSEKGLELDLLFALVFNFLSDLSDTPSEVNGHHLGVTSPDASFLDFPLVVKLTLLLLLPLDLHSGKTVGDKLIVGAEVFLLVVFFTFDFAFPLLVILSTSALFFPFLRTSTRFFFRSPLFFFSARLSLRTSMRFCFSFLRSSSRFPFDSLLFSSPPPLFSPFDPCPLFLNSRTLLPTFISLEHIAPLIMSEKYKITSLIRIFIS
mmetsp:Transcript_40852/g.79949  ORF Transcript_40852/g.79949 Transcript_40852/m.79949 type:complete len:228 (-) Transcript_40852:250-933(-)